MIRVLFPAALLASALLLQGCGGSSSGQSSACGSGRVTGTGRFAAFNVQNVSVTNEGVGENICLVNGTADSCGGDAGDPIGTISVCVLLGNGNAAPVATTYTICPNQTCGRSTAGVQVCGIPMGEQAPMWIPDMPLNDVTGTVTLTTASDTSIVGSATLTLPSGEMINESFNAVVSMACGS